MKDRHDCENQMIKPDVLRSQTKSNKSEILLRKGKVKQVLRRVGIRVFTEEKREIGTAIIGQVALTRRLKSSVAIYFSTG